MINSYSSHKAVEDMEHGLLLLYTLILLCALFEALKFQFIVTVWKNTTNYTIFLSFCVQWMKVIQAFRSGMI